MSARTLPLGDGLYDYLLNVGVRESALLRRLREETSELPEARMQISPEQGSFMHWLVATLGARRCLEVGVFTGYSSICTALALPADGVIVACDVSEAFTSVARRYWKEAGVDGVVQLRLAPALDTLAELVEQGAEPFDFAFIDADKENYDGYFELSLKLLRPGGTLAFDNAFWGGSVADANDTRETASSIRALNAKVCSDARVAATLLPVGDGMLLARKL